MHSHERRLAIVEKHFQSHTSPVKYPGLGITQNGLVPKRDPSQGAVVVGGMVLDIQARAFVSDRLVLKIRAYLDVLKSCKMSLSIVLLPEHRAVVMQAKPDGGADIQRGGSVPGVVQQTPGGVARNIAHSLLLLCRSLPNKPYPSRTLNPNTLQHRAQPRAPLPVTSKTLNPNTLQHPAQPRAALHVTPKP
jgi:hypothetical protein